jgi:hypothetical protein
LFTIPESAFPARSMRRAGFQRELSCDGPCGEAYSQALKKRRDEERKSKALDEARAILEAAGIDLKDIAGKIKRA